MTLSIKFSSMRFFKLCNILIIFVFVYSLESQMRFREFKDLFGEFSGYIHCVLDLTNVIHFKASTCKSYTIQYILTKDNKQLVYATWIVNENLRHSFLVPLTLKACLKLWEELKTKYYIQINRNY